MDADYDPATAPKKSKKKKKKNKLAQALAAEKPVYDPGTLVLEISNCPLARLRLNLLGAS